VNISHIRNAHLNAGKARANKIITEQAVYSLVFQRRKPEAKAFRDWVTGTVLPAIHKDGGYVMGEEKVAFPQQQREKTPEGQPPSHPRRARRRGSRGVHSGW
jgi:prophage antirepressor-like protein